MVNLFFRFSGQQVYPPGGSCLSRPEALSQCDAAWRPRAVALSAGCPKPQLMWALRPAAAVHAVRPARLLLADGSDAAVAAAAAPAGALLAGCLQAVHHLLTGGALCVASSHWPQIPTSSTCLALQGPMCQSAWSIQLAEGRANLQ